MTLRPVMVVLHRWCGLATAIFLAVAGLTGSLIAWDHELDAWLNPGFYRATPNATARAPLVLAHDYEAAHPDQQITWLPLALEPGETLRLRTEARTPQNAAAPDLEVALAPDSGELAGAREWGSFGADRLHLIPFIYKLHYSLQLPDAGAYDIGVLLMGLIGMVWTLDSFVALWLSFPKLSAWRKSFAFRVRQGNYKLIFDLHRSGGVWLWLLVLTMAVTSVSMNLSPWVMRPLVNLVSPLTPQAWELKLERTKTNTVLPRAAIVERAQAEARQRGWQTPVGGIYYSPPLRMYGVGFFAPGMDHGDIGLGNAWLYYDGLDGKLLNANVPGAGSAGDIFMQAQFPLHSGRILGLGGRILVSALGLAICILSITGIFIWARKRRARQHATSNPLRGQALTPGASG